MKLYVVMVNDRHTEPYAEIFSDPERAVEWARSKAKEWASNGDYEEEQVDGCLFCARYSCEGDAVWVIEKELDKNA